jgi:hypothetical protein
MSGTLPKRPRGLRWSEPDAATALLRPAWSNTLIGLFVVVPNVAMVAWFETHPSPGKSMPWYLWACMSVTVFVFLWQAFYPLWGGQRLVFDGGVFRVGPLRGGPDLVAIPVAHIAKFAVTTSRKGAEVQAVCGGRPDVPLPISSRNPLFAVTNTTPDDHPLRLRHGEAEAEFIAHRLGAMLLTARERPGNIPVRS